ncbi:histidine phosphatase family protein [Acidiphilium multivorum]|uniref:histidine phosphatase family protein n=1 Tax=Acidiphilium multivorum TaxID=62140 RepID=UPI0039C98110
MPAAGWSWALRCITDPRAGGRALLLARHGRTAWTGEGRYQGRSDLPLSPEGWADAAGLAAALSDEPLVSIYTSPLLRARQTAGCIAARRRGVAVIVDDRLAEIAFGDWEGRTQAEIRAATPEALRRWKRDPGGMRFPGGETLAEARARLHGFFADLPEQGGAVLAVTHAGMIRLACLDAEGRGDDGFRGIRIAPGAVRRFSLGGAAVVAPSFQHETVE